MVELRKRKAHQQPTQPPPAKKKSNSNPVKKVVDKVKAAVTGNENGEGTSSGGPPSTGSIVTLGGFGGEIETNDGQKTTLKKLVDESSSGVVIFTYPKASTPGCTKQACMFRDDYTPLTATGFAIYGLSRDSSKANTTFKTKQKLPYTLLCDPSSTLIGAIGMKSGTSTTRGVFVVDKEGKVLAAEAGGPAATVDIVKRLVAEKNGAPAVTEPKGGKDPAVTAENAAALAAAPESNTEVENETNKVKADVAADVADSAAAAKLDTTPQPTGSATAEA